MMNKEQLMKVFSAQYDLNTAYNGEEWKTGEFVVLFQAAADAENAEMLAELEGAWKWYYKGAKNDFQAALFEAIDVLHFSVASMLAAISASGVGREDLLDIVSLAYDEAVSHGPQYQNIDSVSSFVDLYPLLRHSYGRMLDATYSIYKRNKSEGEWSANYQLVYAMGRLIEWLNFVGKLVKSDGNSMFQAYLKKNTRNHQRVAAGVMRGVDVKSKEEPLTLETV